MSAWSRSEAQRTLDEVKRRSQLDAEFRELALKNPLAAIARVNPRPLPPDSVRFVESHRKAEEVYAPHLIVIALPDRGQAVDELTADDLESVAGGTSESGVSGTSKRASCDETS